MGGFTHRTEFLRMQVIGKNIFEFFVRRVIPLTMKHLLTSLTCLALLAHAQDTPIKESTLFDGKSLVGWTQVNGQPPGKGWQVVAGVIQLNGSGGNLISAKEYEDFELQWDWKVEKNGNNGIKYWVSAVAGKEWLGIEYQMIDDLTNADAKSKPSHATASFYDIKAAVADKPLKPAGEWNASKVIAHNGKIQHFLNGTKVAEADTKTEDWRSLISLSKFKGKQGFAAGKGRIMLTDHQDKVWIRGLSIREIK